MVGRHHQLSGYECEQTSGDCKEEGSLVCCSSWGHKEPDLTTKMKPRKLNNLTVLLNRSFKLHIYPSILELILFLV